MAAFIATVTRLDTTTVDGRIYAYVETADIGVGYEVGPAEILDGLEWMVEPGSRVLVHEVDAVGDRYVVAGLLAGGAPDPGP